MQRVEVPVKGPAEQVKLQPRLTSVHGRHERLPFTIEVGHVWLGIAGAGHGVRRDQRFQLLQL